MMRPLSSSKMPETVPFCSHAVAQAPGTRDLNPRGKVINGSTPCTVCARAKASLRTPIHPQTPLSEELEVPRAPRALEEKNCAETPLVCSPSGARYFFLNAGAAAITGRRDGLSEGSCLCSLPARCLERAGSRPRSCRSKTVSLAPRKSWQNVGET